MKKIILATIITLSLTNVNAMNQINASSENKIMAVKHLQSLLTTFQQQQINSTTTQTLVNPDTPEAESESESDSEFNDISEEIKQLLSCNPPVSCNPPHNSIMDKEIDNALKKVREIALQLQNYL